jgi:hypothetical protein
MTTKQHFDHDVKALVRAEMQSISNRHEACAVLQDQ